MAGKETCFIVDAGATFSLLTSYSGPNQDSELTIKGVSGVPLRPKISSPLFTLSIWKIDPYTLIPHNASVPNGIPRERFIIQIGGLYYHTPLETVSIFCMQMAPGRSLSLTPDLPLHLLALDPQVWVISITHP